MSAGLHLAKTRKGREGEGVYGIVLFAQIDNVAAEGLGMAIKRAVRDDRELRLFDNRRIVAPDRNAGIAEILREQVPRPEAFSLARFPRPCILAIAGHAVEKYDAFGAKVVKE